MIALKKHLGFTSLVLLVICTLLILPSTASAELLAGVQVGYGFTSYSKALGTKLDQNSEWTSGVWAKYRHEDLLFTGLYQGGLGLKGVNMGRHLAQIGANYRFLKEDLLQVYGGLGYQMTSTRFETPKVEGGKPSTLTGHGFAGQVVVDIAINEKIRTMATITGNPWLKWAFNQGGNTTSNIDSGSSFTYMLDILYDFSADFGLHLGLSGGSLRVPSFAGKGETKGSYSGINLGVTRRF